MLYRNILTRHPLEHSSHVEDLSNLGTAVWHQYERDYDISDLAEAIALFRDVVRLCSPADPKRGIYLQKLGLALEGRYYQNHNAPDLDEAIQLCGEAVRQGTPGDSGHAIGLRSLGSGLWHRYERDKNTPDLAEAITFVGTQYNSKTLSAQPVLPTSGMPSILATFKILK